MATIKCKICGGTIIISPGEIEGICDSCGQKQIIELSQTEIDAHRSKRSDLHYRLTDISNAKEEIKKKLSVCEECENRCKTVKKCFWWSVAALLLSFIYTAVSPSDSSEDVSSSLSVFTFILFTVYMTASIGGGIWISKISCGKIKTFVAVLIQFSTVCIFGIIYAIVKNTRKENRKNFAQKQQYEQEYRDLCDEEEKTKNMIVRSGGSIYSKY